MARSRTPAIRSLAEAMVRDHSKTAREGLAVAQKLGDNEASLKAGDDNQIEISRLAQLSGSSFEREYVKMLIDAHQVDINTATDSLAFARDEALRTYLQTAIAIDRKHLQMAKEAAASQ